MVSSIVARAPRTNDRWFTLATSELGTPKSVLQDYAAHGDSLSLAILIHVTRQYLHLFFEQSWRSEFLFILETVSKFDVRNTSLELQHDFCVLWNEVVRASQKSASISIPEYILRRIRNIYITLHQNTDAVPTRFSSTTSDYDRVLLEPSSYPVCNVPDHYPHLITHIHEDIVRTSFARDFASSALPTSAGSTSSAPTQVPANVGSMDVPPVDDSMFASFLTSSLLAHQITAGVLPNSAVASAAGGNDTDRTITHSTTETRTSTRLFASISSPGAIGHQLNADLRVFGSHIPPSPPIPVLGDIPLASLQLSSDPHAIRPDHAPSGSESRRSTSAAALPQSVSEPEWVATAASRDPLQLPPLPLQPSQDAEEPEYQPLSHSLHNESTSTT